jgi:hypothetical protein
MQEAYQEQEAAEVGDLVQVPYFYYEIKTLVQLIH